MEPGLPVRATLLEVEGPGDPATRQGFSSSLAPSSSSTNLSSASAALMTPWVAGAGCVADGLVFPQLALRTMSATSSRVGAVDAGLDCMFFFPSSVPTTLRPVWRATVVPVSSGVPKGLPQSRNT